MTDPIGKPEAPVGGDFSQGTFEQVLFAITGYGPDLHGVLETGETPGKGWFVQGSSPAPGGEQTDGASGGTGYSYHAWDKWYIAVNRDAYQPGYWDEAIGDIDGLADALNTGKLGLMDVNRLWDAKAAVDQYVAWLHTNHEIIQQWVNKLTSDDSGFKGKAAHAIQQTLSRIAHTINDLHEQIVTERGTPESLRATAEALATFARGMANVWWEHTNSLKYLVNNTMNAVVNNVHRYIMGKGLAHGTPNYVLDMLASDSRERAEAYIKRVVTEYSSAANTGPQMTATPSWSHSGGNHYAAHTWTVDYTIEETGTYPFDPGPLPEGFPVLSGPLDSAATWDGFNRQISKHARDKLEPLNVRARELLADLQAAYERTKKPLDELDTPIPPVTGGGGNVPPPGGGGNLPPPPGGGGNLPPPPGGGGNLPPPGGGGGNLPPPGGGGGNLPPPGGGGNVPPPGGTGNIPPPLGGPETNGPPGGENNVLNGPPGGGEPPGGGTSNLPPGSEIPPPGGDFSNLPPDGSGGPGPNGNGAVPPILPPGALPPPLSNSAPPNAQGGPGGQNLLDENGNPVDANGNPLLPPGDLPPSMNNFPGGGLSDSDLPGGNSDLPGDFSNFPGDFSNLPGGGSNGPGGTSNLPDFSNLPGGEGPGGNSNLPDFSNLPGGEGPGGNSNLPDFSNLPGGGPGGTSNLPDFSNLPGGGGGGGAGDFSNLPGGGGGGAPGGDFSNLPGGGGGGAPGGGGGGAPGGGAGGFGNSPGGGFGGEGWSDWSGQNPTSENDGSQVTGSSGGQRGGMPMMPPMMPPMGGNQGDSKERERQTWLSEDDKVWGTNNDAGNGVIGLPNDPSHETDEQLAPTHVHMRTNAPRAKTTEQEQKTTEQTATT